MSIAEEKFKKASALLAVYPYDYIVGYQGTANESSVEYIGGISMDENSRKYLGMRAVHFQKVALFCYTQQRDLILSENLPGSDDKDQRIRLNIRLDPPNPALANSLGRRWRYLFIGSGAIRKAGCVIAAKVAAKNQRELDDCIAKLQASLPV